MNQARGVEAGQFLEDLQQYLGCDGGNPVGGTGEDFEESHARPPEAADLAGMLREYVGCQRIIHIRPIPQVVLFLLEAPGIGERPAVGVLHDCGHASARSRPCPRREVLTGRIARLHQMHMGVDHPGEHKPAIGFKHRIGGFGRVRIEDCRHAAIPNVHIGP